MGCDDEAVSLVEADGTITDGVDDYEACCGGLARRDCLAKGLGEQQCTEPSALLAAVDREPRQEHHPDRVGR